MKQGNKRLSNKLILNFRKKFFIQITAVEQSLAIDVNR